jgi:hypothetical protein
MVSPSSHFLHFAFRVMDTSRLPLLLRAHGQYELLQRIPRPQREEGCVLLEFTDRRLGNLTWRMGSYESLQTESW